MFTHNGIWSAIDHLAQSLGTSTSGLAKRAGLDATSFNKSKRFGSDGKARWPSTESIARVLAAANMTLSEFLTLLPDEDLKPHSTPSLPLLSTKELEKKKNIFDANGDLIIKNFETIPFPNFDTRAAYCVECIDNRFAPLYSEGCQIIVTPIDLKDFRRGDRVMLKIKSTMIIGEFLRQTLNKVDILQFPSQKPMQIQKDEIVSGTRILWASQ